MTSDYGDIGSSVSYNSQDESSNFIMPHIEHLEGRPNTDYSNAFRTSPSSNKPIISVARRNERERKRVRLVNQGFAILRDRVPRDRCSRGRRSSKVETLRAAIMYIRQLQQLLLESQIRYQEQDMTSCYGYVNDDSYLNSSVSSVCDTYAMSNGYPQSFIPSPPYPHLRTNASVQPSNTCDRHLAVPWFT